MSQTTPKAALFLGATGGCGLSALRHNIAAGNTSIALCRTPSRLTALLTPAEQRAVRIDTGNAHDVDALMRALAHPSKPGALVDAVIFSIGAAFSFRSFGMDDSRVCEQGMLALLEALARCRSEQGLTGQPRIAAVSSTGISDLGRDVPLPLVPLYHGLLKTPHADKRAMEQALIASGEAGTVVRASLLTDGPEGKKEVREGMEDPLAKKVESVVLGYTISRADVGRWMFDNMIQEKDGGKWVKKTATVTY